MCIYYNVNQYRAIVMELMLLEAEVILSKCTAASVCEYVHHRFDGLIS